MSFTRGMCSVGSVNVRINMSFSRGSHLSIWDVCASLKPAASRPWASGRVTPGELVTEEREKSFVREKREGVVPTAVSSETIVPWPWLLLLLLLSQLTKNVWPLCKRTNSPHSTPYKGLGLVPNLRLHLTRHMTKEKKGEKSRLHLSLSYVWHSAYDEMLHSMKIIRRDRSIREGRGMTTYPQLPIAFRLRKINKQVHRSRNPIRQCRA